MAASLIRSVSPSGNGGGAAWPSATARRSRPTGTRSQNARWPRRTATGHLQLSPIAGERVVRLVAADNRCEAAVARIDIPKVVRDDDEAAVHLALADEVILARVEGHRAPVELRPDGALAAADEVGV